MNRWAMAAAGVAMIAALAVGGYRNGQTPLGPGARFTVADRDRAMRRGLTFLYSIARQPETFGDWGHDLLSAFANLASTCGNREISDRAWRMGHERALEWRREHPRVPAAADADDVANLVYGSDAAELLGVPDRQMHEALRQAAARFSPVAFLGFDPAREPPPERDRYSVYQDALIVTYTGDHYGVRLGGHFAEVLRWLPTMRPYPARPDGTAAYYHGIYTVTHVVYTVDGYNANRISPRCFPEEFAYLRDNLPQAIDDHDPETLGEYLDTLQDFGLTLADPLIRRGVESLLAAQNPDGSWGNPRETDAYVRYHSTWTALNGIQSFRWNRVLPCPAR
ncbi:MAG: hypothetical protein LAP40_00095 [Acidobacteriia bacterium]|nr:hypothetical protein [Terriglobia bacterium]